MSVCKGSRGDSECCSILDSAANGGQTTCEILQSLLACAAVSFTDQYHKLYVPGRHFDDLDLVFDVAGYLPAVLLVFMVWSVGSSVYRLVFRK